MSSSADIKPDVVFILGIMPRSGTNFLANLVCQHPDCTKGPMPEDGLIDQSALLKTYAINHIRFWNEFAGKIDFDFQQLLFSRIGDGLLNYLRDARTIIREQKIQELKTALPLPQSKYLVTKSPSVINAVNFFKLFPDQKLLIIVRDGRTVVESNRMSFAKDYETEIKNWVKAAQEIMKFEQRWQNSNKPYLIIKYEDLHNNTVPELNKILKFLDLDISKYNLDSALNMPITGSSDFKRGLGNVHWLPVEKTKDFDPINRTKHWTRRQHERFNWLAADELAYFDYKPNNYAGNNTWWKIWNISIDLKVKSIKLFKKIRRLPHAIRMA